MTGTILLLLVAAAVVAYFLGRNRAHALCGGDLSQLHSRPSYHGGFMAIFATIPAFLLVFIWSGFSPGIENGIVSSAFETQMADMSAPEKQAFIRDARSIAEGVTYGEATPDKEAAAALFKSLSNRSTILLSVLTIALVVGGGYLSFKRLEPRLRTRHSVERFVMIALIACSAVAILTTIGIVLSLIFESVRFFQMVPFFDFLFGIHWSPQSAFAGAGSAAEANADVFGAIPLFAGTLLITAIAILVAAPIGLMSAIYLSDYASPKFRAVAKPILEILAGIPTVVYGFFAALTVAPFIRGSGESIGLSVSSESALAAGLVMGIMIIPFVSSLSDDVINSVPQSLRDGSAGLGATKSETIRLVILPAALPGIVSALLLAISRAIGETMIVVMAAGLAANLTANPLEAVTTVTVQIVTLLVGDQEFDSAKTLAAFALGLVLFCVTLALNVIALRVVQKYQEQYD